MKRLKLIKELEPVIQNAEVLTVEIYPEKKKKKK